MSKKIIVKTGQTIQVITDEHSRITASYVMNDTKPVLISTSTHTTKDPINGKNIYTSTTLIKKGELFGTNIDDATFRIGEQWE